MPLLASAQGGILFPLNWFYLISSPAVASNLMVVSSYMLAGLGAYFYARRAGASISGAMATSIIWQFGGCLIGQIGHINLVQTAAMMPWVLWAVDGYARKGGRGRGVLLAFLIALQFFVGHQQAFCYSLMLVVAYAVAMALSKVENPARYLRSVLFAGAGLSLGAVQIVPTFELLRNSTRPHATYDFFTLFSMPPRFVLNLLAPYITGGGDGRLFRAPYVGAKFYQEYIIYAGVLGLALMILSIVLKPDARTKFWTIAGLVCLVLAFGDYAPGHIYRLIYLVPVLNLFRAPARHAMEVQFAFAVLAGRGLTSVQSMRGKREALVRVAIVGVLVLLCTWVIVAWMRLAGFHLGREGPVSILRAPELFLPILFAGASAWALWILGRGRRGAVLLVLAILTIDLVVWGQSNGWYPESRASDSEYWRGPETVQLLRRFAPEDSSSYRILTAPHEFDPDLPPVPPSASDSTYEVLWTQPDIYMMYGIQNAAGYDGFGLGRYSRLAGEMKVWGELTDPDATLRGGSREMDLLNVRYLLAQRKHIVNSDTFVPATENYGGFMFAADNLGLPNLSAGKVLRLTLPPVKADRLSLLSNLSWSENVPNGTTIGHLRLKTTDGVAFEFSLRAGVETAEWAYDRPDIRSRIRHSRPVVATSYVVEDHENKYEGHSYLSSFALPQAVTIAKGEIEIAPNPEWPELLLSVLRISLTNQSTNETYPLRRDWISLEGANLSEGSAKSSRPDRWKLLGQTSLVDVYENKDSLPRAWVASDTRVLDEEAMLRVIRTGLFPDGEKWDPLRTALVETSVPLDSTTGNRSAEIVKYDANRIDLRVDCDATSLVVLSENHYPGWRAYIDGQNVDVARVDYALRGVVVPAGKHEISFRYRPKSVLIGFLISLVTALVLIGLCLRGAKSERPA
jgi:Bacterial membrane protein YfhO